jgi:putative intracellular protease/amidase
MQQNTVYLYTLNMLADWEPGFALAELNSGQYFKHPGQRYQVKTFSLTRDPIVTMGGLTVVPDLTVDEVTPEGAALLVLPGSDAWLEPQHAPVIAKAEEFLRVGKPVGAICGATSALANAGLLNNRPHTSNDLEFLKATCPGYTGSAHYRTEPAVTDGNLITANGVAPLEFAYYILKKLDVFSEDTLEAWYQLYLTHKPEYFYKLMQSLPQQN